MAGESPVDRAYTAFFEQPFPPDLAVAVFWIAATLAAIFVPVLNESPLRVAIVVPAILFLPGYCLIAALFPGDRDLDYLERFALSFGLSIAVVPLIGLALNFTPWGIRLVPVAVSLAIFCLAMIPLAHYRRSLLPAGDRFSVPFRAWLAEIRDAVLAPGGSRTDRILNILLLIAVLSAVITVIFVIAVPKQGEKFTEFYVLGENGKAADYPDRVVFGQQYPLSIGIGNHEYRTVTYTVETWAVLMESDNETNTSVVRAMDPLWQRTVTIAHNETVTIPWNLSLEEGGYNRVEFLLFNESVPAAAGSDRIGGSYRDLHLWVTVRDR